MLLLLSLYHDYLNSSFFFFWSSVHIALIRANISENPWVSVFLCFCVIYNVKYWHWPVRMQATLTSHHSGIRGRITATWSPLCRPQGLVSTLAAFRDKAPSSLKLHFTSSPLPFTHHRAGLAGLSPVWPGTHGKERSRFTWLITLTWGICCFPPLAPALVHSANSTLSWTLRALLLSIEHSLEKRIPQSAFTLPWAVGGHLTKVEPIRPSLSGLFGFLRGIKR